MNSPTITSETPLQRGEVRNDNPNPHVMKPRTSIDFLFPDTPAKIDEIIEQNRKVCPHCHKKIG